MPTVDALHRRDVFLDLDQKVDRLEPDHQREIAGFENGPGDHQRVTMIPTALTQLVGVEVTILVIAAVRTDEAVRPTQLEQRLEAFLFVAIMFQEGTEAEAILELDRISFRGMYSFLIKYLCWFHYATKHACN